MVYIPGLGESSFPGGKAGIPGPAGPAGSPGAAGTAGQNGYGVSTADGRLTTVSGTPILKSNQLAKTTLYYTPFVGNQIALYSGSVWTVLTFAETALSLSGYTASKNYDIWGYNNAGTLALDSTVWTNDTTRATALTTQDGVYVKSGDATRRYMGTVRINSTGGQIDWVIGASGSGGVEAKITIWNENNRVLISNVIRDSASSWTHANNSTWSSMNASTNNRQTFIIGRSIEPVTANLTVFCITATSATQAVAFGLDSTSSPDSSQIITGVTYATNAQWTRVSSTFDKLVTEGNHFIQAIDYAFGGTATFYGLASPYAVSGFNFRGYF